jgi:transcriptional regulator with XRE-family HTH domain
MAGSGSGNLERGFHMPKNGAAPTGELSPLAMGVLLREWRAARRMSQLDLALEAGMSARHLSCIETGKARPSREAVGRLADTLGMPLRERNRLMRAAGFVPEFFETPLLTPALERMRQAIALILQHQEPYPAFVVNRHWEIVLANEAARRMNAFLMRGKALRHGNMLHQVFDPDDFRQVIANWSDVAGRFVRLLHEEIAAVPSDHVSRRLLDEILAYPDVPERWRNRDVREEVPPILNLVFHSPVGEIRFFETITTFAGAQDVTLDELRIECSFPADEKTAALCARLRSEDAASG